MCRCTNTVSALRSPMQENHKFKVRRLRGKLQSNTCSQNNKVEYGGQSEVESLLALLRKRQLGHNKLLSTGKLE